MTDDAHEVFTAL